MRKLALYIILFIVACATCNYGINQITASKINNRSPFYLCFASIGANSLESRMDCWAKIKTDSSARDIREIVYTILTQIQCPVSKNELEVESIAGGYVLDFETLYEGTKIFLRAESNQENKETFFTCRLLTTSPAFEFKQYKHELDNVPGLKWHYYYMFTAETTENVGTESQKPLLCVVMKNLEASIHEEFRSEAATSMTGYSPAVAKEYEDSVIVGKTRYNVQVAARTTSTGSTRIHIGVPLILDEY